MSGQSGENQGLGDTHRPENFGPENSSRAAKIGSGKASVEAAMSDLVGGLAVADGEQPSLMLDEIDEQMALFGGPVKHVADQIAGARGRGRPKGSPNKNGFRDVLLRMGYRHPGLNLAAIANATPEGLARELLCERGEAMGFGFEAGSDHCEVPERITL